MQKKVVSLEMAIKENKGTTVAEFFKKLYPDNTIIFSDIHGTLLGDRWQTELNSEQAEAVKDFIIRNGRLVLLTSAPITAEQSDLIQDKFLTPLKYDGFLPMYIISTFNLSAYKYHLGKLEKMDIPAYLPRPDRLEIQDGINLYYELEHISFPRKNNLIVLGSSTDMFFARHPAYVHHYGFYVGQKNLGLPSKPIIDMFDLHSTGQAGALEIFDAVNHIKDSR